MSRELSSLKESAARKIIDNILVNLGWETNELSPDCNVFTERAKTKEQCTLLGGKEPDYLLYESGTDRPIAVVEAKRPGYTLTQAINKAIEKYAEPLGIDIVFAHDGTLCESFDRRSSGSLLLDDEPVVELLPPELLLQFANDGPRLETPTEAHQTKKELITIFAEANDLLRKEGLMEGIERFSEFSNLLFLKLISEIEAKREAEGKPRRLESRYCWESFASKSPEEILDHINDSVLPRLVKSYNHSGEVFQPRLKIANASTLHSIVSRLSELSLLDVESDIKGDAFEYFLKNSITVGNDLGEYFTPRHIVKLIVELIDPSYKETVYDPCCGTGGFLIEAFKHIERKVKVTAETRKVLENETIFGRELTSTARIAKMNMILAGDGHTNITQEDALKRPVDGKYDVVLTNFPFSQNTDYSSYYGLDTEDANPVFLKHVIDACADGGRMGVIVPEGLLFGETQQYINVRRFLVDHCTIHAVISLHEFVFRPYTGQPTAILILTKGKPEEGKKVWFYEVLEDGFEKTGSKKGRHPCLEKENDLVELRSVWDQKPTSDKSFSIPLNQIRENSYKLSLSSYRKRSEKPDWLPLGGEDGVCEIMLGATPDKNIAEHYRDGTHLWVRIGDMVDRYITQTEKKITDLGVEKSSVKLLRKGTVLISFKLSIGKVAIAGTDLYTNEAIAGLVPKDERVLPEYLYHLIPALDLKNYMQPAAKGKTLNKKILQNIRIPVPSIEEQKAFVDEMNQLEAKALHLREEANDLNQEAVDASQVFLAKN